MTTAPAFVGADRAGAIDWHRFARRALLAALAVVAAITVVRNALGGGYGLDFHGIWRAGHDLLAGHSPYLAPDWRTLLVASNAFIPPPPLAVLAAPFSVLPFAGAVAACGTCSVGRRGRAAPGGRTRPFGSTWWRCAHSPRRQRRARSTRRAVRARRRRRLALPRPGRGALAVGALIAAKLLAWPLLLWLLVTRRARCSLIAMASALGLFAETGP